MDRTSHFCLRAGFLMLIGLFCFGFIQSTMIRPEQIRGGTAGRVMVDNGTRYIARVMTGDAEITSGGVFTLKKIPPAWDADIAYVAGDIVLGSDGNLYRGVGSSTNNDPTTDGGDDWELLLVTTNTTLSVAAAGRFTLPSTAYSYVKNAIIRDGAVVTIALAGETFTESAELSIASPYGGSISFDGAGSGSTTIDFSSSTNGISVTSGGKLGTIVGGSLGTAGLKDLKIKGTWTGDGSVTGASKVGIFANLGATIAIGADVKIDNFYFGVNSHGTVHADGVIVTTCGDSGFHAFRQGYINASNTTVTGAGVTATGLGAGYVAERGGTVIADSSSATSCLLAGYWVGGTMRADTFTADSNDGDGVIVTVGGRFSSNGTGSADSNGGIGFNINSGIAYLAGTSYSFDSNTSHGMFIASSGAVRVHVAMTASSNGGSGVRMQGGEFLHSSTVTCNSNTSHGVHIAEGAIWTKSSAGTLTCVSNTVDGARVELVATANLVNAVLGDTGTGNGGVGLNVITDSKVYAAGATIKDNTSFGVTATNLSTVTVTGSGVSNNNGAGVQYSPNTEDAFGTNGVYIRTL